MSCSSGEAGVAGTDPAAGRGPGAGGPNNSPWPAVWLEGGAFGRSDAGRLVPGTLATPFLRQIGSLMRPGGVLTMNLMVTARTPDQIHRLARVFTVERELRLRGNLVIHARANQDVSPD